MQNSQGEERRSKLETRNSPNQAKPYRVPNTLILRYRFPSFEFRLSSFVFQSPTLRFSSFEILSASSGKRAYHTYVSLNLPISRAGVPQTNCPARMVLPVGIPACAPAIAPSSSSQWSAMPTCPPQTTWCPSTLEPEIPVCAAITECAPICTLCPTCTRLSSFTPS